MLTFTSFSSSPRSSTIRSRTGETAWHGPHHSAQKSTSTGLSLLSTSWSKFASVTSWAIRVFLSRLPAIAAVPREKRPEPRRSSLNRIANMSDGPFQPLPRVPDHPALELEILETWERERTFEQLREQNRGGERFSFVDGPITANNPMGAHHCWGRTLKDVFQRYKALRGFDQRHQNGFDCQGRWVEVSGERGLVV